MPIEGTSRSMMGKWRYGTTCAFVGALLIALSSSPSIAHNIDPNSAKMLAQGGLGAFFQVGAKHMLTGYDHLLFLFGVMFFLTNIRDILIYITAFTLGHSATLIFATLSGYQANYHLVDAAIAVSVIYKGFDNLNGFRRVFDIRPPNLLAVVFIFGLIHGLGLSTRFQNIGLPKDGLVGRLLAFNAGVEFGQVTALIVMVVILAGLRKSSAFVPISKISNAGLIICGSLLFLFQMHAYFHTAYPDDFGFSTSGHWLDHFENSLPDPNEPNEPLQDGGTSDAEKPKQSR